MPLYSFGVKKTLFESECDSPEYYCCLSQIRLVGDFDTRSFKSLKLEDDNLILLLQQRAGKIESPLRTYAPISAEIEPVNVYTAFLKTVEMDEAVGIALSFEAAPQKQRITVVRL